MLVLSRKAGESLMIGDQISITILSVDSNGQVNIGVSAPREVLVLRSELQKAAATNQGAAGTAPPLVVGQGHHARRQGLPEGGLHPLGAIPPFVQGLSCGVQGHGNLILHQKQAHRKGGPIL